MAINKYNLFKILLTFWVVSFLIFWILSVTAGGDAVNGKIEDGRYYFCSHGEYTEVSRIAYVLSAGYMMILSATVSLFMLPIGFSAVKGSIRIKDFKGEGWFSLIIMFVPLLIGCGFLYLAFLSLKCILLAFEII